jgi:hypothetical protein
MAKNDARKNGFEKTNPEDLAAKEEKFRTFSAPVWRRCPMR